MLWLCSIVLGYLLGSISPAYLLTWLVKKKDIRTLGTGNPGAANVYREVGKAFGILVWLIDTAKGCLAMMIAKAWSFHTNLFPPQNLQLLFLTLVGSAAVLGHSYSIFLRFRGGKGIATAGGVVLYLLPKVFLVVIVLYFLAQRLGPRSGRVVSICVATFFLYLYGLYGGSATGYICFSTLPLLFTLSLINRQAIASLFSRRERRLT